jgi:hypothetical protein
MTHGDNREERLRHGEQLWTRLRSVLDAHLHDPIGPSTDWTGHDVYAHFARWQAHAAETLRRAIAGEPAPALPGDENEINERWRDADRSLSTELVRERCEETREALRSVLRSFDDKQWARHGRHITAEDVTGEHYAHHLADAGVPAS